MTLNQLASLICKQEGKKHQASVGDVREILKIFFDMMSNQDLGQDMVDLSNQEIDKRYNKKNKKKK